MLEVRLLGAVEIVIAGEPVEMRRPQSRAVLAALAVDLGRPVSAATLIDRVWDDEPPKGAQSVLYSHITRLRAALQTEDTANPLVRRPAGYVLDLDPDAIDLHRFRRLTTLPASTAELREALDLWRGEPLAGIRGRWADNVRVTWRQQRLDAAVAWASAAGNDASVVPGIRALLDEYPLAEPLAAALMRVLAATGRTAEALAGFAELKVRLRDELGADPGAELQKIHVATLQAGGAATETRAPIRQLPTPVAGFTGRETALATLDSMIDEPARTAVISAISGTAGIGKTALAVYWAQRVAERFPDGQLYVNLNGFDPGGQALDPTVALRQFLGALGTKAEQIPDDRASMAALYRSLLAGRRMLVLLDNARDPEQVRPLLPGASSTFTVVTSRNWLTSLVAAEGATPVTLDLMTADEARGLLERRLGKERVAAEPEAVDRIIERCARLPLALSIAAARALQSGAPLRSLIDELEQQPWDTLDAGDPLTQVRVVFSWSYRALSRPAARLFRLLGLHPGPDISVAAADALIMGDAQPLLTELSAASLTTEHRPGRYILHDLLSAYAAELSETATEPAAPSEIAGEQGEFSEVDGDGETKGETEQQVLTRLLDHYLAIAYAADKQLDPVRDPITFPIDKVHEGTPPKDWFEQEHRVLLSLQARAAETGHRREAWQLAWCLDNFLHFNGLWHDRVHAWQVAVDHPEDTNAAAHAYLNLGRVDNRLKRHADAENHLGRALALFEERGDAIGQAHAHRALSWVSEAHGDLRGALDQDRLALALFEEAGNRQGMADALNSVGWDQCLVGEHEAALETCERARTIHRAIGDRWGEASSLDSLGFANHHLGRYAEAVDRYEQTLAVVRDLGDRYFEADTLTRLGETHRAAGDVPAARKAWQRALDILTELGHDEADDVRTKINDLR
ncbi:tetratricopeptide repeat protein [Actinoplanes sp. NPDC089786]|uniref:AfsR/SARP family transcriptional regulator n=1 Tax=Actinoplanes sp. NPDC089786 TaxID=3155185 RepID=UPI003419EFD0